MTEPLCSCGKRPRPNNLSVEDTFDIMFGRYQHALEELSEK